MQGFDRLLWPFCDGGVKITLKEGVHEFYKNRVFPFTKGKTCAILYLKFYK